VPIFKPLPGSSKYLLLASVINWSPLQ
jgi:hypothetical protein